jgi:hypothetical protein
LTVKVWHAATGSLQQTIAVNSYITILLFNISGSTLITNIGRIKVDKTKLSALSESSQEAAVKATAKDWALVGRELHRIHRTYSGYHLTTEL